MAAPMKSTKNHQWKAWDRLAFADLTTVTLNVRARSNTRVTPWSELMNEEEKCGWLQQNYNGAVGLVIIFHAKEEQKINSLMKKISMKKIPLN